MKKRTRIMILLICLMLFIFCNIKGIYGYKEPTICYDGQQKEFTYYNMDNDDLFANFKELMPGDSRTQEITLTTKNIKEETKLFLDMNIENESILKKIDFKIYVDEKVIYDCNKEENNQLIEVITFTKPCDINLKVTLNVPMELDNKVGNLNDSIKWTFKVQENTKSENNDVNIPQTGDNILIIVTILIIVLIAMLIISIVKNKIKNKNEN